jgi:DNA-binding NarL/FixJ family response regulator
MPITVCLVEDNHEVRASCSALLTNAPGLQFKGGYASAEEALEKIPLAPPDVALVDIHLPGMSGIECVARLKSGLPNLQILILTLYEQSDLIFDSLRAGANGYLLKSMPSADLIQAVELVHAGGAPMTMSVARRVIASFKDYKQPVTPNMNLSPREREILDKLAQGCRYREIGEALGISAFTVRAHLHSVYKKLHVGTGTQAVIKLHKSVLPKSGAVSSAVSAK